MDLTQILTTIAGRNPLDRLGMYVPHGQNAGCPQAFPGEPLAWCAPCLAKLGLRRQCRDWVADVAAFMRMAGQRIEPAPTPALDRAVVRLRVQLLREELDELEAALEKNALPAVADNLADLIYVAVGAALAHGVDLRPVWSAVQAANMAKAGGPKSPEGKLLKPPGWAPPDVAAVLSAQKDMADLTAAAGG